jgi:hypothetical protein
VGEGQRGAGVPVRVDAVRAATIGDRREGVHARVVKTLKVSSVNSLHVKRDGLACRVACQSGKPLGSRMVVYARLASLREWRSRRASALLARIETQSASGEELSVFMPSLLDGTFKRELGWLGTVHE